MLGNSPADRLRKGFRWLERGLLAEIELRSYRQGLNILLEWANIGAFSERIQTCPKSLNPGPVWCSISFWPLCLGLYPCMYSIGLNTQPSGVPKPPTAIRSLWPYSSWGWSLLFSSILTWPDVIEPNLFAMVVFYWRKKGNLCRTKQQ